MRAAPTLASLAVAGVLAMAAAPARADSIADAAKLTVSNATSFNDLGGSLAMSSDGSVVVAGDSEQGAVYVFIRSPHGWTSGNQVAKLTASGAGSLDQLGQSVAISADGSTIVAGAPGATVNGHVVQGAAFVFRRPPGGWSDETQSATLEDANGAAGDGLGGAVSESADGSVVVAAASESSTSAPAGGYVFIRPGGWTGVVEPTATLVSPSGHGTSVAVSPDGFDVVVGDEEANSNTGAAYVFSEARLLGQTTPDWTQAPQQGTLTASDGQANDFLAQSVSISGTSTVVLQSVRGVYAFRQPSPLGWSDTHETAKLTASDGQPFRSVAISSDDSTIVAGVPAEPVGSHSDQGAIYAFHKGASGWTDSTETVKMAASSGAQNDLLGISVAISENASVIAGGAIGATAGDNQVQGAAYVFRPPTTTAGSCEPTTEVVGQQTTCSFTVTSTVGTVTPTGTLALSSDSAGSFSGACSLTSSTDSSVSSCSVSYTPTAVGPGTHVISASYGGDLSHAPSSATTRLAVDPASSSTSLSCDPGSVVVGTLSGCTVTVTVPPGAPTPTGSVALTTDSVGSFAHGGSCGLVPAATPSTASCELNYTPGQTGARTHSLTATYPGDSDHTASHGSTSLGVRAASSATALQCVPKSVSVGSATVCSATVADTGSGSATPGGVVRFATDGAGSYDHGSCTLSPGSSPGDSSCQVRYTPTALAPRTRTITAVYRGDAAHSESHDSVRISVAPSLLPKMRITSVKLLWRRDLILTTLACPRRETFCDGRESAYTNRTPAVRGRPRSRQVLLGQARFHLRGGAAETLKVPLGKRALRALGRRRVVWLTVMAVAHDAARRSATTERSALVS